MVISTNSASGVRIEGNQHIVFEGFEIVHTGDGREHGFGLKVSRGEYITVKNNKIRDFYMNMQTANASHLVIEGNEFAGARSEHGVYLACPGDSGVDRICTDIVIRNNYAHDNRRTGIQVNGSQYQGDRGEAPRTTGFRRVLLEANRLEHNAADGPAELTWYSVQDSTVTRNTLIASRRGHGITLSRYGDRRGGGGIPVRNNRFEDNTIIVQTPAEVPSAAVNISSASDNNVFVRNQLCGNGAYPPVQFRGNPTIIMRSDFNQYRPSQTGIVFRQLEPQDVSYTLDQWRALTNQDRNSTVVEQCIPSECTLGDLNCDGLLNVLDLQLCSNVVRNQLVPAEVRRQARRWADGRDPQETDCHRLAQAIINAP